MKKFSFAFRTPFTKEKKVIEAMNYMEAKRNFYNEVTVKRLPIRVYVDYIWELDDEGNYFQRFK